MPNVSFPERPGARPQIYAYEDKNPNHKGLLKIGYTAIDVEKRAAQQFPVIQPGEGKPYKIVFAESAMREDGTSFMDHEVHKRLEHNGFENMGGEWYRCDVAAVRNAWLEVRDRKDYENRRIHSFGMRPEQKDAVDRTYLYYRDSENAGAAAPKFLWNAKMRFGKTIATYELAKKMDMKRVLVLTFKPAVEDAWQEDLETHKDFEGWQFVCRDGLQYEECDPARPIVCFGSFQDYLGYDKETGGIKPRNEWVHLEDWDLVVFDEYHFGAWRDNAKKLFDGSEEGADERADDAEEAAKGNSLNETWLPIVARRYLYLSGTPFRALNSGEFIEEQIYSWTYSDEQRAKASWVGEDNPYAALPRMVLMTYKMPDDITKIARQGEFDQFDLNVFFSAEGKGKAAQFKYKDYVQKWLDLIRGSLLSTTVDELKLGAEKPPMPYSDARLLNVLTHTLWFLPNVASCYAMKNLLAEKQNAFYHDYQVICCAGNEAGMGVDALTPVRKAMGDPLKTKTITLSCGKLTTGVTVRPWGGILMLRNLRSPETYFQAAFRVQSPWEIDGEGGRVNMKEQAYIFDFALDRAIGMISDYSTRLSTGGENPERMVGEFIKFLPVLAYDGSAMREVNAAEILDMAMAGTTATLLARRWESALLVNVDNDTLLRILGNERALAALMSIEGFRSLNKDIETIINRSEAVKKAKKEGEAPSKKKKEELTAAEKELKSKRKEIQEKLIKFATRIPVFMYLTDFREACLKDVITQLEPALFKRVTGLDVADFELLVSLGVFNDSLMNDAVYKFRRYEDSSLSYTGIDRHEGERVGLYDTSLSEADYLLEKKRESAAMRPIVVEVPAKVDEAEKPAQAAPEPEPAEPADDSPHEEGWTMDDLYELSVGDAVFHKAFGYGPITDLTENRITVLLAGKKRTFEFPSIFESGFLSL